MASPVTWIERFPTRRTLPWFAVVLTLLAAWFAADRLERRLLWNTATLVLAVECFALPIAALLAFLIARTNVVGRRIALLLCSSLLFVPLYLLLSGWDAAFGRLGWHTVAYTGLKQPWLADWRGAVFVHSVYAIPWATCLMTAFFSRGNRDHEEAALLDGDTGQVLRRVTLPSLGYGILAAAVWLFVITAGEMTVTNIYLVPTYAEEVYNFYAANADVQAAVLHQAPLFLFTAALVLAGLAVLSGDRDTAGDWSPYVWRLTKSGGGVSLILLLAVVTLVAFPIGNLVERIGEEVTQVDSQPVRVWSAEKAARMVVKTPKQFRVEFLTTAIVAGTVAAVAIPLATWAAWATRKRPLLSSACWMLAALGITLPAPVLGISVIWLLNRDHPFFIWLYDRTIVPPVLAILVRVLPLCFAALAWAFATLDQDALDAAALDGAGRLRRFLSIVLPQRWPVVAVTTLAAFVIASGDLSASILTLPPGVETISRRLFGLIHAGVDDQVAAIGLVSWLFYLAIALLSYALLKFRPQRLA